MAVFADPVAAVGAAVECQRGLAGRVTLRSRIGLHTAPAAPTADDYFGPGPNRAARVMAAARGGQVLMSESTAVLVRDHLPTGLEVADLGERQLRGVDRPLHIWAVRGAGLGGDGELESVTAPISPSHDRVVGREGELATLQSAVDAARGGRPNIVLVVGEAGIGKTRLADEAANRARAAGMGVLHGEADPTIREPMELWRRVYRSLGVDPANDPAIPAADRRWEHLDSLAGALRSSAPAIVVLDDLHWADATAVWVLEQLPRALGDAPVALVATSRDGEPDMPRLDALRRVCRVVRLEGLDADAVHQLAAAQASRPIDAVALTARTGGNPLFVRELLYAPDSGGVVGDVLDHSLQQLDADTRRLLGAAAVAGGGTPLWVLAAALGTTSAAAADRLAPAVRAGVLAEVGPTGVRFRHALWAEAAERHADGRDRACRAGGRVGGGRRARSAGRRSTGHRVHAAADGEQLVTAVNVGHRGRRRVGRGRRAGQSRRPAARCPRRGGRVRRPPSTARQGVGRPRRRPRVARRLRPGAHVLRGGRGAVASRCGCAAHGACRDRHRDVGQPVPSRPVASAPIGGGAGRPPRRGATSTRGAARSPRRRRWSPARRRPSGPRVCRRRRRCRQEDRRSAAHRPGPPRPLHLADDS